MSVFTRFQPMERAYFDLIRQGDVRRYDCAPMIEVFHFHENVYSMLSRSPGMGGDAWMHLIVGEEKAMLIDTGFGIGDLKVLVEALTDKPLIVVNTHFHGDHTLGNFQFDKVYCHEYDADALLEQMNAENRRKFVPKAGDFFTENDVIPVKPYEVAPVPHGYTFTLGKDHEVELFHLPGHAPGGCAFLDKKERLLFSGDAIVSSPGLICGGTRGNKRSDQMTLTAFHARVAELCERLDEFDALFPGHNLLDYPKQSVPDMKRLLEAVIADPNCQTDIDEVHPGSTAKLKVLGYARVAYTDDRI